MSAGRILIVVFGLIALLAVYALLLLGGATRWVDRISEIAIDFILKEHPA